MSTHPVCITCNVNYAVFGSDYCPKHGGVVPRTIKEYDEIRDRLVSGIMTIPDDKLITGAVFSQSPGLPIVPNSDRLSIMANEVRAELANAEALRESSAGSDWHFYDGKVVAFSAILANLES